MAKRRLDFLLARAGLGTRKEVKKLIKGGQCVFYSDPEAPETLTDPATKLDLEALVAQGRDPDTLLKIGRDFLSALDLADQVYLLWNKGPDLLSDRSVRDVPSVLDLLPENLGRRSVQAAGRLDYDSEGLLLLTDDGDFLHRIIAPRYEVEKVYLVAYQGLPCGQAEVDKVKKGLRMEEHFVTLPASLVLAEDFTPELQAYQEKYASDDRAFEGPVSWAAIHLQEGKFHQVKRMFEALGRQVVRLVRVQIGPWALPLDLEENDYLYLDPDQVADFEAVDSGDLPEEPGRD